MTPHEKREPETILGRVLVVDDEENSRESVAATLRHLGADVRTAAGADEALRIVEEVRPDAVLSDVRMPARDGFALLESVRAVDPHLSIVLMSAFASIEDAVAAMRIGAEHYIAKPIRWVELSRVIGAAIRRRRARMRIEEGGTLVREHLMGESEAMQKFRGEVSVAAGVVAPAMIVAEPGIGSRRIAEALHGLSANSQGPLVVVDCATVGEAMLFGDREIAADSNKLPSRFSVFDEAAGGTVLLDDVDALAPALQSRLARILPLLQSEARHTPWASRCRVVAATTRDFDPLLQFGLFRSDLLIHFSTSYLRAPPLRERREDVPALAEAILAARSKSRGMPNARFSPSALQALQNHPWPGNDLELENVIDAALVSSRGGVVTSEHVLPRQRSRDAPVVPAVPVMSFAEMERRLILTTYEACQHNVTRTAEMLGLSTRTIHYRLREYRGAQGRRKKRESDSGTTSMATNADEEPEGSPAATGPSGRSRR